MPAFRRTAEQVSIEDIGHAKEDRIADPDVIVKGILGINDTAPPNENTGYYLDHVAIEVDMSEVGGLDRGLEGLPINVEGHFEVREDENPDSPIRWIFKAHSVHQDLGGGGGGMSSVPPPN